MKKIPFLFLSLIFSVAFASNSFDYELIRTKEVPGFFMTKIFATNLAQPLKSREIFVKNFPASEEKFYRELFPFLQQERQAKIINFDEFQPEKVGKNDIVVSLGSPLENSLNFKYDSGDIFSQFQNFAGKELSPVILDDLKIQFGGNVFDVQAKQKKITANSPAIFVGKFSNDIKTRMKISGKTLDSNFELVSPLDLAEKKHTESDEARYLPELWNQLANPKAENPAKKINWWDNLSWLSFLPYVLGIIALLILILFIRYLFRNRDTEYCDEFNCEEEIPIFQFEIPEEEYKKYEEKIGNTYNDDLPFEVIWKE